MCLQGDPREWGFICREGLGRSNAPRTFSSFPAGIHLAGDKCLLRTLALNFMRPVCCDGSWMCPGTIPSVVPLRLKVKAA